MSRIRVAYDSTSLLDTRTGISHTAAQTLETLAANHLDALDLYPYAITWSGRHDLAATVPATTHPCARPIPARLARWGWQHLNAPRIERWTGPVDVVHATAYVVPPSKAPVIVTIADLNYIRYPEFCTPDVLTYPAMVQRALDQGAVVHTISEFVNQEVRDYYNLPAERVVNIYPGILPSVGGDPARGKKLVGSERYLVSLGTIEPRKNLPALVRSFDEIAANHPDLRLAIVGAPGWGSESLDRAIAAAHTRDRIVTLGYVDESTRCDLLAGTIALVYPSFYEGFGLPPLEAAQAGVPTVASNAGSLPEVLGDSALLPDPNDEDAIKKALSQIINDKELRATLVARGRERLTKFSWEKTAAELCALYQRVAQESPRAR